MEVVRKTSADFVRLFDILTYQQTLYPNKSALNAFRTGRWQAFSVDEVQSRSDTLACWLLANGYVKGEKVAIVPHMGSPEWVIIDLACQQIGLVVVPVHPTAQEEEIKTIFSETEARLCLVADSGLYYRFSVVLTGFNQVVTLFHLDPKEKNYFNALEATKYDSDIEARMKSVRESVAADDVAAILYTSGSSGIPKGVVLTHRNITSSIKSILTLLPLEPGQRVLSFLPFSHIFERVTCYAYMAFGLSVYFSQSKDTFATDFRTVKPHFCTAVPRVLEKMYDFMIEQTLKGNKWRGKIIRWAMKTGQQYRPGVLSPGLLFRLFLARHLVLKQWRKKLGGKIKYMVVGAASLRPDIGRLFSAAGIFVVEGYGMTETAPFISVNRFEPGLNRFGTVGFPVPGIEIKIDEPNEEGEGEILVKGNNVMKGYFNRPELNNQVFTADGWFRTGDIGKIVYERFLTITDRKKDIFKTSSGKYIAPQPLQNHIKQSMFVERCLILGFQKPYLTALIVPNFEVLQAWCEQEDIHWTSPPFMVYNIKVREKVHQEIDRLNEDLLPYQRIKNFVLCHQDWSVETGELTSTLKPVRHLLMEHYQKEIDKMYPEL